MTRNTILLAICFSFCAHAVPVVGTPVATAVLSGGNYQVTASARITISPGDPALIAGGVNLLRVDTAAPSVLGVMHDDGINGDAAAGDGLYTLTFNTTAALVGQIQLQASAAFRGVLLRVRSVPGTITQGGAILQVSPASAEQGQQGKTVTVTGQGTHWAQATTTASFGAGITVGTLTITSSTSATVSLNIDAAAALGTRSVMFTTGAEVQTLNNGFTVTVASTPAITSSLPGSAPRGQSLQVTITGQNTHFVQGVTKANFGPGVSVGAAAAGAAGPVTVTSPTSATATLDISASAATGSRNLSVQTSEETASLSNAFSVKGTPSLASITPNSAHTGDSVQVTIQGAYTSFQQGVTTANFGVGIAVGGGASGAAGPVTVTGPTTATAQLTINANATVGVRNPVVQTGSEQAQLVNSGFSVLGAVTGPAPTLVITSPAEGAKVTNTVTVTGTVTSPNLAGWVLEYQTSGTTPFTKFASGTTSNVSASFDPSMLLNGIASLRLTATDLSGQSGSTTANVVIASMVKVGNFTLSFNDLTVPVAGIPITIVRNYDSRNKGSGDFGFGWSLDIKTTKIQTNNIPGDGWKGTKSGGFIFTDCVVPGSIPHVVTIRLSDGTTYTFNAVLTNNCQQLSPPFNVDMSFVPSGTTPPGTKLTIPNGTGLYVENFDSSGASDINLLDPDTFDDFDPDQFTLTTPNGVKMQISKFSGVQSVSDPNGHTLTFSTNGITSNTGGIGVTFTRDGQGRITSIKDPNNKIINYTYSATGDLSQVKDALNHTSTFNYDSFHNLVSFTDASGHQPVRSVYDDSGRLIQVIDAFGNPINLNNNVAANTETISDALGNQTTYIYDANGNITSVTDALGHVMTSTFDANSNLLTHTDPLGHTTTFTYDANGNPLTQADALGHSQTRTYDASGNVLTATDANGHTITNTYDAKGNILTTKDPLGNTTTYTYDASGNQLSAKDAMGHTANFTYSNSGHLTTVKDAAGVTSSFVYDANGNQTSASVTRTTPSGPQVLSSQFEFDANNNVTKVTNPDGTTIQRSFDVNGLPAAVTDAMGRTTSYTHDPAGHITQMTLPGGLTVGATYDANGNANSVVKPNGAVVTYTYDAAGRPTSNTNSATGATTFTTYDAAGNRTAITDPRGNVSHFAYDAANRLTSTTDALNHTTSFGYDNAGNQTVVQDANGHTVTRVFDNANRVTKTTYPDNTNQQAVYDANGKLTSATDANGKLTTFTYDSTGHLLTTTDALGQITSLTYDEVGEVTAQTDANGHTTTFTYDSMGRRTSRKLPGGQTESFAYDAAGNLISHTDFKGKVTAFAYDAMNRMISKTPDASFGAAAVAYTYSASGKRTSMTDATGVTTYTYDAADRIIKIVKPNGTLNYSYDVMGNLTSITTGSGTNISYSYDQLNRLASVNDTALGATNYSYDAAGNLLSVAYPNGVTETYTYNAKNQLTNMTAAKGGTTLASYAYTLDAVGHRVSVTENTGRVVTYVYDSDYRLVSETVAGAPGGPNGTVSYGYDPVGNRLQTTSSLAGVAAGAFTYDVNDRLTAETYDANGNATAAGGVANVYDFENRLIQHGAVTYAYDGDGNRVSKTAGGVTTKYLVDNQNPTGLPQVIEESMSDGSSRHFAYGLTRISQQQTTGGSSSTSFYIYDGHGSVRALADAAGAATDTYDYDAFGILIHSTGTTPNEFRFAGEQFDADAGIYYNRARYFNQATGRFWSMDMVEGDPHAPLSLHKYLYTGMDPVNLIDPTGNQFDMGSLMVSIAISTALDAAVSLVLNTPLGNSALAWVATHLMPAGFFDFVTRAQVTAGLIGANISASFKIPKVNVIGITGGAGADLVVGLSGQAALYRYYGGGLTFGATATSAGVSGYGGALWQTYDSTDYEGVFYGVTIPLAVLPPKILNKLRADVLGVALNAMLIDEFSQAQWLIDNIIAGGGAKFIKDGFVSFFVSKYSDSFGVNTRGSAGFSTGVGLGSTKGSSSNISITYTQYDQVLPTYCVPFASTLPSFKGATCTGKPSLY